MAVGEVKNMLKTLKDLDQNYGVVSAAKEFTYIIKDQIDEIIKAIQSISDEVATKLSQLYYCKRDVKQAANSAFAFIECVNDIYEFAHKKDAIERIKSELENGNESPLETYIAAMDQRLAIVGEKYEKFSEHCEAAEKSSSSDTNSEYL